MNNTQSNALTSDQVFLRVYVFYEYRKERVQRVNQCLFLTLIQELFHWI